MNYFVGTAIKKALDDSAQGNVALLDYHQLVVMSLSLKVFVLFSAQTLYLINQRLQIPGRIKLMKYSVDSILVLPQRVGENDNKEKEVAKTLLRQLLRFPFGVFIVSETKRS